MLNFNTNNYNASLNTSNTQNTSTPSTNSGTNTFNSSCAFSVNQQMMSMLLNLIQLLVQNLMNNGTQQNPNMGAGTTGTGTTGTGTTGTGTTGTGTTGTGSNSNISANGKIWGDPHFVDADGGNYDVQGSAGKTYNILSDKGLQVNAEFKKYGNATATAMGEVGITMGKDQVEIDSAGKLMINGEAKQDGAYQVNGNTVEKHGDKVSVQTAEYKISSTIENSYINLSFSSSNVMSDGVDPHGLWGQTADGDGVARNGDTGSGAQGGGAIEKLDGTISAKGDKTTVNLYEVGGLFDTQFANFYRFDK